VHIGIIEDNPSIRELLVTTLEWEGHTTGTHSTGVDFVQRVFPPAGAPTPFPYDMLIVDIGLPGGGISGEDVLARLDQHFTGGALPVIVLSGAGSDVLGRVHRAFPNVAILTKPMHRSALLQTIAATHAKTGDAKD
jgi:CheY-like chemotaxis protein